MEHFKLKLTRALHFKVDKLREQYCIGCQDKEANQMGYSMEDWYNTFFLEAFNLIDGDRLKEFLLVCMQQEQSMENSSRQDSDSNEEEFETKQEVLNRFYNSNEEILNLYDSDDEEEESEEEEKEEEEESQSEENKETEKAEENAEIIIIEDDDDDDDSVIERSRSDIGGFTAPLKRGFPGPCTKLALVPCANQR